METTDEKKPKEKGMDLSSFAALQVLNLTVRDIMDWIVTLEDKCPNPPTSVNVSIKTEVGPQDRSWASLVLSLRYL